MSALESLAGVLLAASLRASAVLAGALALRWLLRRARLPRLLDALWLVVLARLLVPVWPAAPWSALNLMTGGAESTVVVAPAAGGPAGTTWPARRAGALAPSPALPLSNVPAGAPLPRQAGPLSFATGASPAAPALLVLWALGTLIALAVVARSAVATRRLLQGSRPVTDPAVVGELAELQRRLGLRRPLRLHESATIGSPALAGWWRPVALVPAGLLSELSSPARSHVLLHEIGHLCRRDLWVQRLFKLVLALHWWNPLVWLANRLARADREVACDDWVLRRLPGDDACEYGETLLALSLRAWPGRHLLPVGMAEDGGRLGDRVRRIAGWQRAAGWRGGLGIALASAFAAATMADEYPGPLRPLAFTSVLDATGRDRLRAEGLWADTGSFATARRFRVRGRYRVSGCDQAVLVAETLGTDNPEPVADQVKLVPCGTGGFEMDFAARDHAPGGVALALMNARGACGLVGLALYPPVREFRLPARRVRDICWRSGTRVSPGYEPLAWVGEPGSQPLPDLPLQSPRPSGTLPASDSLATDRSAILFENQSQAVVFLHWMDFRGRPRLYGFLSPGESFRAWTANKHAWTVSHDAGQAIGSVTATLNPARTVIR
jgi:beta-lactamase regulating signal transducer with metallopeptidase domain